MKESGVGLPMKENRCVLGMIEVAGDSSHASTAPGYLYQRASSADPCGQWPFLGIALRLEMGRVRGNICGQGSGVEPYVWQFT